MYSKQANNEPTSTTCLSKFCESELCCPSLSIYASSPPSHVKRVALAQIAHSLAWRGVRISALQYAITRKPACPYIHLAMYSDIRLSQ